MRSALLEHDDAACHFAGFECREALVHVLQLDTARDHVIQVHYMKPLENRDYSGVTLDLTTAPISKRFVRHLTTLTSDKER